MQTLLDFEQHITNAVIDLWQEYLRSNVHAGGRHFKHTHIRLTAFSPGQPG